MKSGITANSVQCDNMRILVCVKEVPDLDPEVELKIDQASNWIQEEESSRYMMNRFDEAAVEEALQIKEHIEGVSIDAVTFGPKRSHVVVRRAMGMGVDHGIHIVSNQNGYLNPFLISKCIAEVAGRKRYDLILTGVMAEDTCQGQTGVMIAERLGIPWASSVIREEISGEKKSVLVEREIEGGTREELEITLPCLLTIQTGINQPRYPALSKVLKARKADLEVYSSDICTEENEMQQVINIGYPSRERQGEVLAGTAHEKAATLIDLLVERSFIR